MFLAMALLAAASMQQPGADQPKDDPVICRTAQSDVGTHMRPKRVCMKRSEWTLVETDTQTQVGRIKDRNSFDPGMAQGARPH